MEPQLTVGELREQLSDYDKDTPVMISLKGFIRTTEEINDREYEVEVELDNDTFEVEVIGETNAKYKDISTGAYKTVDAIQLDVWA